MRSRNLGYGLIRCYNYCMCFVSFESKKSYLFISEFNFFFMGSDFGR